MTMSKKEIKAFAQELEIPHLVHFTHISNLESIMEKGLLSRKKVDDLDEDTVTNDEERHDRRTHTISLSIAHPNDLMFYKYRDKDEDWCVIGLKKKVLWELGCLFLKNNAADARMSNKEDKELSTLTAFRSMYDEMDDLDTREEQCLKPFDPTDKQAEILVPEEIPVEYIIGVYVSSRKIKKLYSELLADYQVKVHSPDKGVYASRLYRRKWQ
jgi:hypothetical protein